MTVGVAEDVLSLAEALGIPPSVARILSGRGLRTPEQAQAFLNPSLAQLAPPSVFSQMQVAVNRLLQAVRAEEPVAIYADRDVDGLTGLAVLVRTLRSLGGRVVHGSPMKGRGVERDVLNRLASSGAKVIVLVDCGTGEHAELGWLKSQGIDVIVADHHRIRGERPAALAWIHPEVKENAEFGMRKSLKDVIPGSLEPGIHVDANMDPPLTAAGDDAKAACPESRAPSDRDAPPAGCVMAFKLAQAIWLSFLGNKDEERLDYFLFSHMDLIALGILADRMPLRGENRVFVWHGLRRLAGTRKAGLGALTRFFRCHGRATPPSVREATWQIIPLLNAGGRLGRPDVTAELLITEDLDSAHECIDLLLEMNTRRRAAQDESVACFEKAVLEQCTVETDPVLVALAQDLEPSVTGLAANALARKYNRPAFLFVTQGEECVGSGRGVPGVDLFAWVEQQHSYLLKYGGHGGAVGLTIRTADFAGFRGRLLTTAQAAAAAPPVANEESDIGSCVEADVSLSELNELWWMALERLAPFGMGNPWPLFRIHDVTRIESARKRRSKSPLDEMILRGAGEELQAAIEWDRMTEGGKRLLETVNQEPIEGPFIVVGHPMPSRRGEKPFHFMVRDIFTEKTNG